MLQDADYLRITIDLANESRARGNHPFGALLVGPDGDVLLTSGNTYAADRGVGHAEANVARSASRKYEPAFTKSVLDAKEVFAPMAPTQRYSDAELLEFRELVQNKLNTAKQELNYLNGLITRKDSMSGGDSDNRYMTMEDGSLSMEREQLSQMASRQIDFIEKLEKAMMRIQNKTYGICRVTGKLIDRARLRAVPHATLSMEAKTNMNKPGSSYNQ